MTSATASAVDEALRSCEELQHMIEINADHLDRLRTRTEKSASELTKQEIRTLEGKLIKHFSKQLTLKSQCCGPNVNNATLQKYPSLPQWLKVSVQ